MRFITMLLALIGLAIAVQGANFIYKTEQAKTWPTVKGIIIDAPPPSQGTLSEVTYQYTVGEDTYQGSKIRFGGVDSFSESQRIFNTYTKGKSITVYHAPDDASLTILEPTHSMSNFIASFMGIFLFVAALVRLFR